MNYQLALKTRERALNCSEYLLRMWLPDGKLVGSEYIALNPTRTDHRPGSFKVNCRSGRWADFATGDCGRDLISLRAYLDGSTWHDAASTVFAELATPSSTPQRVSRLRSASFPTAPSDPTRSADQPEALVRVAAALDMWCDTQPIHRTPAERYLKHERGLAVEKLSLEDVLRWHAASSCMCALMTNALTGQAVGVHRTFVDSLGRKISRKMLGRQGVIKLSGDDEVSEGLAITEGVEDGLAVILSGWWPVWAATSAGAVSRFPVLRGTEALTIFADADEVGRRSAQQCRARWVEAGRSAQIIVPGDFIDG